MSHISPPNEFEGTRDLFYKIKARHDADAALPAGSVLTPFLTEQDIDLDDDKDIVDESNLAHNSFTIQVHLAEEKLELRRLLYGHPVVNVRACAQFLKRLKHGKVHELGAWGLNIDGVDRINYPSEFKEMKKMVVDFIAKHNSFPAGTSPLKPYLDIHSEIDLAQDLLDINAADTANNEYIAATLAKETFREERDVKMDKVAPHIDQIGQYLMKLFNTTPHRLGAWGFNIDEANSKPTERRLIVKAGTEKTIYKAVLRSIVVNNSTFPVNLFAGKGTTGTPIVLAPGQKLPIKFGFGTFTVQNPSLSDDADLSATTYHG